MMASAAISPLRVVLPDVRTAIPFNSLFTLIMALAIAVSVLIAALLAYSLLRARRRSDGDLPPQDHGNRKLEVGWTAVPAVIVTGLFVLTFFNMRTTPTPGANLPEGRQPDIIVIGHQWWWEFQYPQLGIVTANELHLPAGKRLLVQLTSADVQHNFWVPPLGQKMDLYPGKANYLWLEAPEPGLYQGVCAEYCGTQHAWMRILAIAQTDAEFDQWVQQQQSAPTAALPTRRAEQGQQLFVQLACVNCHAVTGLSDAQAGPNLTHFGSRRTLSAMGVSRPTTRENVARYLENPQAVKPGIYMPNFGLSPDQIDVLVEYLESLR